jgi:hypothetical protein
VDRHKDERRSIEGSTTAVDRSAAQVTHMDHAPTSFPMLDPTRDSIPFLRTRRTRRSRQMRLLCPSRKLPSSLRRTAPENNPDADRVFGLRYLRD